MTRGKPASQPKELQPGDMIDCRVCGGEGFWRGAEEHEPESRKCPACDGDGRHPYRPLPPRRASSRVHPKCDGCSATIGHGVLAFRVPSRDLTEKKSSAHPLGVLLCDPCYRKAIRLAVKP